MEDVWGDWLWEGCSVGLSNLGVLPLLLQGLKELITVAHFASLRPFVAGEGGVWRWKAEAGCRGVRMWGAARVLVAGGRLLSALLRAEVRATPQCKREAAP